MSCFLVPAAAALATTIVSKAASKKQATEKQTESGQNEIAESRPHHSFKAHLNWLMTMLWGCAILL
ncbi:MAG: hypothetical protein LUB61_03485 [Eggerthellaceae bacterium]|nr:hypothetical protein [Eggerthellaceae bacterium]